MHNIKAKKSLGQNFLIDNNIINKISDSINATSDDLIIEIGPGMGALTKELKNKNCHIICYEIDTDMMPYLNKLTSDKVKVIYGDILKQDIKEDIKDIKYNNLYIVGNLPYYITTSIIKFLINEKLPIYEMIFMVQEEVADRFTASEGSKDYGSITLFLKYYFNLEKLFKVSKKCFNPVPKVESAIIKLSKRKNKLELDDDKYFKFINDVFRMKRKTLKNNLSNYVFLKVKKVLDKYNLPYTVRGEELSEEILVEIFKEVC